MVTPNPRTTLFTPFVSYRLEIYKPYGIMSMPWTLRHRSSKDSKPEFPTSTVVAMLLTRSPAVKASN